MKSSRPASAQWRSSKTRTTGAGRGDPLEERPPGARTAPRGRRPAPRRRRAARAARGSIQRRSASSGTYSRDASPRPCARVVASSSVSARPARRADHLAERPERDALAVGRRAARRASRRSRRRRRRTSGTPTRAGSCRCRPGPVIETSRGAPLARGRVEQVLEQAQLVVAADERRLEPVATGRGRRARRRPAAPATPATGASLPLRTCSPAGSKAIAPAGGALRSPRRRGRCPGAATDWSRDAVLTRSPATMPWFVAPSVTAASPVRTPARAWIPGPSAADRVDELERGPDGALGVVLVGDRRAPDGHDRVADELLDGAAVALDDLARAGRSSASAARGPSSASRPSASVVKPTRSANRTVTRRRSATGASLARAGGAGGAAGVATGGRSPRRRLDAQRVGRRTRRRTARRARSASRRPGRPRPAACRTRGRTCGRPR